MNRKTNPQKRYDDPQVGITTKKLTKLGLVTALCTLVASQAIAASSIGVNFEGRNGSPGFPLAPTDTAGVVPQANWKNIPGEPFTGTTLPLPDNTGGFTAVTLNYQCSDSWSSDGASGTPDEKLMKGCIKANPDPDTAPANNTDKMVFIVGGLGAGPYDVIVYCAVNGASAKAGVNVGATTYYLEEQATFGGSYVAATSTDPNNYEVGPNYVRFDGVMTVSGAIAITATKKIENPQVNDGIGVTAIQVLSSGAFPPNTTAVVITSQPTSTNTFEGSPVSFTVAFTGPGNIQWQKDGVDISGATGTTYTHTALVSENGAKYTAKITNNLGPVTSSEATLTVTASPAVLTQGFAYVERWENIGGATAVDDLKTAIATDPPTTTFYVGAIDVPQTAPDLNNFGARVSAWVKPDVTGDYYFFIRSDDASQLFLNPVAAATGTNTLPDVLTDSPICEETGCCAAFLEPDLATRGQTTPTPISLEAGKLYGLVAIYKEGGGGDFVQVAWRLSTDTTPAANLLPIGGANISTMASPGGKTAVITTQPAAVTTIEGVTATFNVVITTTPTAGNYAIQWLKNGTPIPGATKASYTTPILTLADTGTKYKANILTLIGPLTTDEVNLTVNPDNVPPVALSASAIKNDAGGDDVGVLFSEKLTETTATNIANYTIAGATVSSASYMASSPGVILRVTGLTAGAHSVNVKNVTDVKGNPMATVDLPFATSAALAWGEVGADQLGLGFGKGYGVLPVGDGGFDVFSDGFTEWAAYDETTFVYEVITGDFDKKVRVEYQDNSSQWARAGLIMREVTNFGVDRAAQEGGEAGRYQKVHVNPTGPTLTGPGTAGNNSHEGNRRLDKGGQSTAPGFANNTSPAYPDAWVRLQRLGQTNNLFRSDDGIAWSYLGQTVWDIDSTTDGAMTNTVYVGPEFSPENGNVTIETDRTIWLAKFRNYGDTFQTYPAVAPSGYSIGMNFGADDTAGGVESALDPTEVAGIPGIAQKNWNNLELAASTKTDLVADQNGVAQNTATTVTWNSPNLWTSEGNGEINNVITNYPDHKLLQAYLDTGDSTTTTVQIQNVPSNLKTNAGGYDVYVYFCGGIPGRAGAYRVVDGTDTTIVLKDYVYARGQARIPFYQPVQANTSSTSYGVGNYLVFKGLTAGSIQIEATTVGTTGNIRGVGAPRAPINAIQLVTSTGGSTDKPTISIGTVNGVTQITFTGRLTSSTTANGTYTDVPNATSPYTVTTGTGSAFYRSAQ